MAETLTIRTASNTEVVKIAVPGPQGATGAGVPTGGSTGQVLRKASAADYATEWAAAVSGSGSVTSVALASSDFTISGSPITDAGTITANLGNTGVTAGTYTKVTVDAKGRVTTGEAATASDVGAPPTSRTISAGTGLTGGGDLSANRTLSVSFGSSAGTVAEGNDSRLSDSRTPTAHAASHAAGQADELFDQSLNQSDSPTFATVLSQQIQDPSAPTQTYIDISNGEWVYANQLIFSASDTSAARSTLGLEIGTDVAAASHTHAPSEVGLGNVSNTAQVTTVSGTAPIVSSGGTTPAISITDATTSASGAMSASDKTKLDGIASGATANSSDATLLARANHTGTQAASTITGLATVATTGAYSDLTGKPTLFDPASPGAIGGTSAAAGTFTTLTANNGTLTASAPVLDLAQTWNNASVAFTALKIAVTNTASASTSALADLSVGAASMFSVTRTGSMVAGASAFAVNGASGNTGLWNGGAFGWSSSATATSSIALDTTLFRDSANTLAQRNGTNPQTFRLYNTFTSATNFERLNIIAQSAASAIIGTEKGSGGGTARGLELRTDNVSRINISATGGIGFYGAAAAAQPAAVADATDAASTQARLNDLLARLRTIGIIAT